MNKLVAIVDLATGALLVVVPRWVFPPCSHGTTRCSDTAAAETILGIVLLAAGALAFDARRPARLAAYAVGSCVLLAFALVAPSAYGYCASPRMPCHYGMVPLVRLVSALAATILVSATVSIANAARRARESA